MSDWFARIDLSDLLASVAIVISIITLWRTNKASREIANKELSKIYFDEIFLEFLLNTFPKKIMGCAELMDGKLKKEIHNVDKVIMDSIKCAKPYEYINHDFYIQFCTYMGKLEEHFYQLIELEEKTQLHDAQFEGIRNLLDELAKEIYDFMRQEYSC